MNDDKVINLEEYRKEKNKGTPIPTLKAFLPDEYYIFPEKGLMIHVLFITDKSIHYDENAVYVMEDQYGNFFADVVEDPRDEILIFADGALSIFTQDRPAPNPNRVYAPIRHRKLASPVASYPSIFANRNWFVPEYYTDHI